MVSSDLELIVIISKIESIVVLFKFTHIGFFVKHIIYIGSIFTILVYIVK